MGVVVVDILGEDRLELTPVEDQYPVEALAADCADEMLGEGVGPWCSNRRSDDPNPFGSEDPLRRRIRGVAAQSVLVALLLCAANLRKIDRFLVQAAAEAAGTTPRLRRRRRTRALEEWLPEVPPLASPAIGSSDLDPPTAA
jgi:hypothetical protein